jgi:hypothetical protein
MMNRSASVDFIALYGPSPEGIESKQSAAAWSELGISKALPYGLSS